MLLAIPTYAQPTSDPLAPLGDAASDEAAAGAASETWRPSESAVRLTHWVISSRDNGEMPFIVIDKIAARIFVFDPEGQLLGSSPILLGVTPGDDSAPGIGDRELSQIPLEQRTTPAGRFVATFGPAAGHHTVLWIDFTTALSLHAVARGTKKERRQQRLNSPTPDDNRITYGCINVPARFYGEVVRPLFRNQTGIVYILPESRPLPEVFSGL